MSECQYCGEPTDVGPCNECCPMCELCDERPATHVRTGMNVTPTDRGDLIEYEDREVCDECAEHMDQRP